MTTIPPGDIWGVNPHRLRFALSTAHEEALAHIAHYPPPAGQSDERPHAEDPFAIAIFDLAGDVDLTRDDFSSALRVITAMDRRMVAHYGVADYDQPIAGPRYAVAGRRNLCPLEIVELKAAEILVADDNNLALLHGQDKWPGATASFGGVLLNVTLGGGVNWPIAIAGSGYKAKYDLLVVEKAQANVRFELIEMGAVDVTPVNSPTFLLGPDGTWAYPGQGVPAGGN